MKTLIVFILFGFPLIGLSQEEAKPSEKQLKKFEQIKSVEDARKFKKQNEFLNSVIFRTNSAGDSSDISKELFEKEIGGMFERTDPQTMDKYLIKVLDKKTVSTHRVSYIFLDGKTMPIEDIRTLRDSLMRKCIEGASFAELANSNSMDGTKNGDLGWFVDGNMVKEFEEAVKKHKKGELFTVDVDKKMWYYLVHKTHASKEAIWFSAIQLKL